MSLKCILLIFSIITGPILAQAQVRTIQTDTGTYEGETRNGKPHGKGTFTGLNGKKYEGEFKNGQMDGYGVMRNPGGDILYDGEWKNGSPGGKGTFHNPADGGVYVGTFTEKGATGFCLVTFPDGSTYEGDMKDGVQHGKGIYRNPNGFICEGVWQNGVQMGKGKLTTAEGDIYEGELKSGRPEGYGKTTYHDGDIYVGTWKSGLPHGRGKYIFASGESIEGDWINGKNDDLDRHRDKLKAQQSALASRANSDRNSIAAGGQSSDSRSESATAKSKQASASQQPQSTSKASSPEPKRSPTELNGHYYVDLGLSVKWATCNVGASSPGEYGAYYAWGETETKTNFNKRNYRFTIDYKGEEFSKYVIHSRRDLVDNKTCLELSDDVASAEWGGSWRMPTSAEWQELLRCSWTWSEEGGHKGFKVTGKNGNSIFLPAAGRRVDSDFVHLGSRGSYWTSTLSQSHDMFAYGIYFTSGICSSSNDIRGYGLSVRPVTE